jgi:hypothetical protein
MLVGEIRTSAIPIWDLCLSVWSWPLDLAFSFSFQNQSLGWVITQIFKINRIVRIFLKLLFVV